MDAFIAGLEEATALLDNDEDSHKKQSDSWLSVRPTPSRHAKKNLQTHAMAVALEGVLRKSETDIAMSWTANSIPGPSSSETSSSPFSIHIQPHSGSLMEFPVVDYEDDFEEDSNSSRSTCGTLFSGAARSGRSSEDDDASVMHDDMHVTHSSMLWDQIALVLQESEGRSSCSAVSSPTPLTLSYVI